MSHAPNLLFKYISALIMQLFRYSYLIIEITLLSASLTMFITDCIAVTYRAILTTSVIVFEKIMLFIVLGFINKPEYNMFFYKPFINK